MNEIAELHGVILFLTYEIYDYGGYHDITKRVEILNIDHFEENIGVRGGHWGWSIKNKEGKILAEFGRKHYQLFTEVKNLLIKLDIPIKEQRV